MLDTSEKEEAYVMVHLEKVWRDILQFCALTYRLFRIPWTSPGPSSTPFNLAQ